MTKDEAIERIKQNKAATEFYAQMISNYRPAENELKDIEAFIMAIEALSANYTTKEPNDIVEQKNDIVAEPTDLISRADVLALAEKGYIISNSNYKKVCDLINELPSADRPSGK